ncbi:hypothetical protein Q8A73_022064 [Channa argus]|nr:hypothetical protein Q8A73_022064 [Channa argus]
MPRYCAVKACRNRGGSASRQNNKRISFYPFPLHDKTRLQKWMDNMKREEWTPSRHQYLCSEHFTEDCFDIRWGIRYLKNTAIPTIFPSADDAEPIIKRITKAKAIEIYTQDEPTEFDSPLSKRPLILSRTCKKSKSNTTNNVVPGNAEITFELPLVSDTGISCHANLSEMQTAACEILGDSGIPIASCVSSVCSESHSEEQTDSTVAVLCFDSVGSFCDAEVRVDATAFQAALGQAFSLVPLKMVKNKPTDCFLDEGGPSEGEHISAYEHSYCRPDTDKDQLWTKILSLHAKILELDRREEATMAKIHALETEITLLKRDGAVFKEKQKVLEDYISSVLL